MENINFYLYLISGYAMITMGIFTLRRGKEKLMAIYLVKSLKYLGLFGITLGFSEWVAMVINLQLYPDWHSIILNLNQIVKALSFSFLMFFGLDLLPLRSGTKQVVLKIPIVILALYLGGFILLINGYGLDYHINNPGYSINGQRYLMGFLSCALTALAFYSNARSLKRSGTITIFQHYKSLAVVFLGYGILEGLFVSGTGFFPANGLNKALIDNLEFVAFLIKSLIGFIIIYYLIRILDTISEEQDNERRLLEKERIAAEERRKLGLEIHDSIIQRLYGAGLKVEYLQLNKDATNVPELLEEIKNDLNGAINTTRDFISVSTLQKIWLEDLSAHIEHWIKDFNKHNQLIINLHCKINPYNKGYIIPEKSTQIFYVIQEALTNILKHSEADTAEVLLEGTDDYLSINIVDNGKGIDLSETNLEGRFGIRSMRERTERAGGVFTIERIKNGTRIELKIPWEGLKGDN